MITVFYDGKCGLCAREISHYRRIAPDGIFNWQDITQCPGALDAHGVSFAEGLKLLHAEDAQGRLHVGVDAFVLIWRQIRAWRILAAFIALPLVRQGAGLVYRVFAAWRFGRLSHCRLALKQAGPMPGRDRKQASPPCARRAPLSPGVDEGTHWHE